MRVLAPPGDLVTPDRHAARLETVADLLTAARDDLLAFTAICGSHGQPWC